MLVALASATAIAILLPAGPDDGCPSPRQVGDAVSAHLPGVVLPLGRAPGPSALRLSVTSDTTGTLRVDLSDPDGGPLLRRRVAPETVARTKAAECVALAETAALIVDRYWHEVGYEVPPAAPAVAPKPAPPKPPVEPKPAPSRPPVEPKPPAEAKPPPEPEPARELPAAAPSDRSAEPAERDTAGEAPAPRTSERPPERRRAPLRPPSWWLAAGIGGEAGDKGPRHPFASLAVALERTAFGRRLGLRFSVTGREGDHTTWSKVSPSGDATVVQIPVGLDAYLAFPVGLGRLEPSIGGDLNVIFVTSSQSSAEGTKTESRITVAPAFDALLAWTIPLPHDIFLRARVAGAVGVAKRLLDDANGIVIAETPIFRAELGLELGVWFY